MAAENKKQFIRIRGANENNLKNLSVDIPRDKFVVLTGLSGSGKSSLAFDTIYAEGQRRYMESLSSYARQFLGQMEKPDVESIEGLPPAISIDQKSTNRNPRSTVGTVTEIYDYFRLFICPRWYSALSEVRQGDRQADCRPDGGSDHGIAGAYQDPASCTGSTRPQGHPCEITGSGQTQRLCACGNRWKCV